MLALSDTTPSERWLMPVCRFSGRGVDAVRRWVASRVKQLAHRPLEPGPIQEFQNASLDGLLLLWTSYAYADVPVGTCYDLTFSYEHGRLVRPEPTSLFMEHIVWEHGRPLSALEHGHKHIVAFRIDGALPAALAALPVADDMESGGFSLRAGICAAADWDAIRRGRLISVLRESVFLLRADLNSGVPDVAPAFEALAGQVNTAIDTLESGRLPDRRDVEALLAHHGPLSRACSELGRSRDLEGTLARCPSALEDAFGQEENE